MKIIISVPSNTDDSYFQNICSGFKKKYGEDTAFVKEIRDDIIGGFIAEADGMVFDTSVASKLEEIKRIVLD